MIDGFLDILRTRPEIALFLTLALGYVIGRIKLAGHALGLVTGALFAGLLIGQIGVHLSSEIKTIFLLLFLFANGYGAGPQFFRALQRDGFGPLLLTLVVCFTGLLMVWLMSRIMGLETGYSAGLLSGSLTQSSAMGTAAEAIANLPILPAEQTRLANQIPIADAVCYLFGFWGEVLFVATMLPRLMGIDLEREARTLEHQLGMKQESGLQSAYAIHATRAFRLGSDRYRTAGAIEMEAAADGMRVFVLRVRRGDNIEEATPATELRQGDVVAVGGQRQYLLLLEERIGAEEDDAPLLDIPIESGSIIVTKAEADGKTFSALAEEDYSRGVFVAQLMRGQQRIPVTAATQVQRGDLLSLIGNPARLSAAAEHLGYRERSTLVTNMLTLGLGIALGCLVGLPAFFIGGVKLALSTSVGTLLAGLFFGWLHSRRPWLVGHIPEPSRMFLVNFGLAGFVAITGLRAGPEFIGGLMQVGIPLFLAGIICTCVPPTVGVLFGRYVLKMNPILLLGGVAGAQTMTAAMVAVQERAKSQAPVLGFTVPYALGNIILTTFGTVIVLLTS
jgi:putative transport protein